MIKKLIILAVLALLVWGLWFFVLSGREVCTVTLKTGAQEQMTVKEIRSIYAKDAYNWHNYSGCAITGEGKITEITTGAEDFRCELPYGMYYTVKIGTGIKLLLTGEQLDGFAVDDKVSFSGKLATGTGELHVYVLGNETESAIAHLP